MVASAAKCSRIRPASAAPAQRATLRQVEIRSLGYRTDLMIRVLEGSLVTDRGEYVVIRTPQNPDYWWGNFLLLRELPDRAEPWLGPFAAEFPAARHVTLGVDVGDATGAAPLAGMRAQVLTVLSAGGLHEPPFPHRGAVIRPLAGGDDWRQAALLRAEISAGTPGADPQFLTARVAAERALTEAGHGWWFGAFVGGELAATLGVITDGSGLARYQNVETHPGARRQGLAGTLVWQAGLHALRRGARTLVIVADPAEDAIRVYRSVGFTQTQTQVGYERAP
jgi:GNAT superfamily N-acetyltransferase